MKFISFCPGSLRPATVWGLLAMVMAFFSGGLMAQSPIPRGLSSPSVKSYRDLAYVENGHERQKLDLHLPEKTGGTPLPLIIWVHGGGWQNGSKDQCLPLREGFTSRGYAVASLGYRLSSHAVFPAQIQDCKAAIRWLRAHAADYGLDPARFGVWGSSAGGHLVALIGTAGEVKEFDVGGNSGVSSRVQAVCDFYGPTDFVLFVTTPGYERHAAVAAAEARLLGGAVLENKEKASRANPITYVTADDPPFLIVHGDKDPTVPLNQSQALFEALKASGVGVHFHTLKGAGHGGPGFTNEETGAMVGAFFDKILKAPSGAIKGPVEALVTESEAPVTSGGGVAPGARRGPSWEVIARRDDRNNDGKVTRAEFSGPAPLFERLDANRDGTLTKDEISKPTP